VIASTFVPELVYGAQAGQLKSSDLKELQKTHAMATRMVLGTWISTANTAQRIDLGLFSIDAEVTRARLALVRTMVNHPVESYRKLVTGMLTSDPGGDCRWRGQVEEDCKSLDMTWQDLTEPEMDNARWRAMLKWRLIERESRVARDHPIIRAYPLFADTHEVRPDGRPALSSHYEIETKRVLGPDGALLYERPLLRPAPYIRRGGMMAHLGYPYRTAFTWLNSEQKCPLCETEKDSPEHLWTCSQLPQELKDRVTLVAAGRTYSRVFKMEDAREGMGGKQADVDKLKTLLGLCASLTATRTTAQQTLKARRNGQQEQQQG
jgi:hypothetical protein